MPLLLDSEEEPMHAVLKTGAAIASSSLLLQSSLLFLAGPLQAQTFEGTVGCPPGTREGERNFVQNGFFTQGNSLFLSDLPYRGDNVYPDDPVGGISVQDLPYPTYFPTVNAIPFPGDTPGPGQLFTAVPPSDTFLYSNPNQNQAGSSAFPDPIIWRQNIAGLAPNGSYNFSAYFLNLLLPGVAAGDPIIRFSAGPIGGNDNQFVPTGAGSPVVQRQQWRRVQGVFRTDPNQTSLELRIVDQANTVNGDDFGFTAVGLRECLPLIGVAKQAGTPRQNADNSFTIPYTVTVQNMAPATSVAAEYALSNVQLQEDLGTAFRDATIVRVGNVQSQTLAVNPNFNGTSDQNLLRGTDTLRADVTATVSFEVTILPGTGANGFGPFENTVLATGRSPGGETTRDRSNDGTNPDPDGDRNPGGPGEDTPTVVLLTPARFFLSKRITAITRNGAPLPGVNVNQLVIVNSNDQLPGWSALRPQGGPVGIAGLNNILLQGNDEVEYTIYFLSDGRSPALDVRICDAISPGTRFITDSNRVQLGATTPLRRGGTFYSPLAPLPNDNGCRDQSNGNGSLIFDLGTVPNTTPDNVGFVRFRVRIE
jgi:uncharacterized repeat protein (TIGR01451 family)